MDNDQTTLAGEQNGQPMTKEHLAQVSSFAAFLSGHMVDAINSDDNLLNWQDTVFAVGLAVRAIGRVTGLITARTTGQPVDAEDIERRIDALLTKARNVTLTTMQVENEAEADAYLAAVDGGFH